jgi:hypothetical protein
VLVIYSLITRVLPTPDTRETKMVRKRCNRTNKVIFYTELDAKIALASRVWRDKGEVRFYGCHGHFHLTSMPLAA